MAVYKDYYYGSTHIIIHDDCFVSKDEAEKIIERIGINASRALMAAAMKAAEESDKTAS